MRKKRISRWLITYEIYQKQNTIKSQIQIIQGWCTYQSKTKHIFNDIKNLEDIVLKDLGTTKELHYLHIISITKVA